MVWVGQKQPLSRDAAGWERSFYKGSICVGPCDGFERREFPDASIREMPKMHIV
jgi:hypothetical protein